MKCSTLRDNEVNGRELNGVASFTRPMQYPIITKLLIYFIDEFGSVAKT